MKDHCHPIPDVSKAYQLWVELVNFNLNLALSTSTGSEKEKRAAWERFQRGQVLYFKERDAMWERMIHRLGMRSHGP